MWRFWWRSQSMRTEIVSEVLGAAEEMKIDKASFHITDKTIPIIV